VGTARFSVARLVSGLKPGDYAWTPAARAPLWALADLSGRLVELSAGTETAHLTAAVGLVLEAQLSGDRAAWITLGPTSFFPPDIVESGVDLDALPVVRAVDVRMAGRAADHLVRSGGFGLVVIDLSIGMASVLPVPLLTRLLGLARQQDVTILLLTRKSSDAPSMHSLVALRAEAQWRRRGRVPPATCDLQPATCTYDLCIRVIKDKRSGAGWTHVEACHGPAGLR
jgi:recombination protein RecA